MSALYRAEQPRQVGNGLPEGPVVEPLDGVGVYLTNEAFLYRVVGFVASKEGDVVELEDCYWLDVVRVPVTDVRARELRVVTPAPLEA